MKSFFQGGAGPQRFAGVQATIRKALASAGLDTTSGPMRFVTDTIEQALAGGKPPHDDRTIDVDARFVDDGTRLDAPAQGRSATRSFASEHGARNYLLHVPAKALGRRAPLVVMLHGYTQSPEDFARGTGMDRLADEHGFLVVYPEQAAPANASKCWNWFQPADQARGRGEPAILAGIVREVMATHEVDPRRVFVAGLSAGAAMAVVLAEAYPELFAAVGVHSGLPFGSAQDIPSAMAKMKGGRSGLPGLRDLAPAAPKAVHAVPTLVFHGDRDATVHRSNADEIVAQAVQGRALNVSTDRGTSANGRGYSRTVHRDAEGRPQVEHWTIHGAGHAWAGGSPAGSYTDPTGPDASAEMVRFFREVVPGA